MPVSAMMMINAKIAPSHVNEQSGIDLSTECSCVRTPMVPPAICPCVCHENWADRVARHRRLHVLPAGWCPACTAIEAGQPLKIYGG